MPRLPQGPPLFMILVGLLIGAGGLGLILIGVDERLGVVVSIGAGLMGSGLASILLGVARGALVLARKSREVSLREYRRHRELWQPTLVAAGLLFLLLTVVTGYNYAVWYEIERDCELALESDDRVEALTAWWRGTRAMESPALLIPSDLLDLWGPNRCRAAAERHGFPPESQAGRLGGPGTGKTPPTPEEEMPGRPQLRRYSLRDQELTDSEFAAWLAETESYNGLTSLVFDGNRLTAVSVRALAASEIGVISNLFLGNNPLGDEGAAALAAEPAFQTVTILGLARAGLTGAGLKPLFGEDSTLGFLVDLDLNGNPLGDEGARIIAESPITRQLTHLYLDEAGLTDLGALLLAESPRFTSLEYLSLDGNQLTETGVEQARARAAYPAQATVFYGEAYE